jgi:hypothetical protein
MKTETNTYDRGSLLKLLEASLATMDNYTLSCVAEDILEYADGFPFVQVTALSNGDFDMMTDLGPSKELDDEM